ncbi:isoprenylcysteine carboxylmethyltransferase family protein [Motiliproteus coralliicola]|uniref:Isoprenylcysteine carboxylmethyltransferase family protein n=1 Tax=Motiliproteus coralliicola TaxID=2283196 RepID=A0A369WGD7_9GAMM|nr:isoprenylcysteine carboxylmethyltransferase family protein [Motiliproteus coralliicola]RDE19676.1 isoprenylcysteine carboxylmethyltransferase family protein [Motiliproteus coralliicola]
MVSLELKIPPVLLVILFATLMWAIAWLLPSVAVPLAARITALLFFAAIGVCFSVSGVYSFNKAKTTVNPTTPNAASALVTKGIYRHTRNPMYVGFLFALIGWGLFLANLYALVLTLGFVWYMNRFQIQPEEQALDLLFGSDFLAYKKKARRWL